MTGLALAGAVLLAALPPADLERESTLAVRRSFESAGRRVPQEDPALAEAARRVARQALRSGSQDAADPSAVSEALSDAGASDPQPRTLVVRASLREEALKVFRAHPELSGEPATHLGVGVAVRGDEAAVVALFTERRATLEPFPRRLEQPGAPRELCGRLAEGLGSPEVHVTRPSGRVEHSTAHGRASHFCAPLSLPAEGRHEVEVVAQGPQGPQVVALFLVDVGRTQARAPRSAEVEPDTVEAGRAHVLERVNALRRAHGLSAVQAEPTLDAVAQAYSERMAREGFFAHVAPDGEDLRRRLGRAGFRYRAAGENLGFAAGPLAAQRGIERSPAHRGNLLVPSHSRMGIGIAFRQRNGQREVLLTQVLAEPLLPTGGSTFESAYAHLNARRRASGLAALVRSEVLEQIALDHARRAVAADEPSPELPGSVLHERAFGALPELDRVTVDLFVADGPTALPDSANLLDARNQRVGLGFAQGDSARFGPGRTWVVIIYGTGG